MTGPTWMETALAELGQHEIAGDKDNPRIVAYHQATTLKATDDETPWCAAFVNWCLREAKVTGTQRAMARSFVSWGVQCHERYGAIVVLTRGTKPLQGHVGFLVDANAKELFLFGGNQGNAVSLARYERTRLIGMRWPYEESRAGCY